MLRRTRRTACDSCSSACASSSDRDRETYSRTGSPRGLPVFYVLIFAALFRVPAIERYVCSSPSETVKRSTLDRKSTRLNSSHGYISYAVFCLKKKNM